MLFQSVNFLYFFAIVYAVAFLLSFAQHRLESFFPFKIYKVFLLAVSYYFYGYWDWRFVLILLVSTIVDYWVGIKIFDERQQHGNANKFYIGFSLVVNLGILGFFKYYNFFIDSANLALQNHGISFPRLTLILPLGLSFYIFETISYSIDVYRGKLEPTRDIIDFALYLAFFPHLLAGPILRATDFLVQLLQPTKLTLQLFFDGLQIFLYGLFLKVVIADNIAPIIDPIFADPTSYDSVAAWVAVLGYSTQIFCDFFGYSEMAIGLALTLGFVLPTNFKAPYSATDLFEFWRRWHISLSTWLRDYLYISLGGNQRGGLRTAANAGVTMLLGGLWHGANWKFVLWGAYHGLGIMLNRFLVTIFGDRFRCNALLTFLKWLTTFLFVSLGWVLFRSQDLTIAGQLYRKLFFLGNTPNIIWENHSWYQLFFLPFIIIVHLWFQMTQKSSISFRPGTFKSFFYIILMVITVFLFSPSDYKGFIYFQF